MRIITKKIIVFILFFSILIFFSSGKKCEIDDQIVVFKDVNVITMCNDSILMGYSVLIKGSKIVDIGIFEEMDIPKAVQLIDGKEQYLIPGLGDMHVHLTDVDDRLLYIANGVTLIRNMAGFPYHLKLREDINKKHLIGPEIYTTGPLIEEFNPKWPKATIVINDKEKVFDSLSQMKNDGYDAIKVYDCLTKEVYYEILRVANKLEMPVVGHVPISLDIKDVLLSGQTSIEHLDGYERYYSNEQIIADMVKSGFGFGSHFSDEPIILETVKSGIWNCPTLSVFKNYENLNYLKKNPPKEIKYVNPNTVRNWNTNHHQKNMGLANNMKLLNTLTNNNANIVSGTDASVLYTIPGFSLHEELLIMQEAGLTPYQILLSATRNCAEMLEYESRLGTIEKEKDADLVLLKNNPLENIKNTKSIVGVMTKGSWYSKEDLDSMLKKVEVKWIPLKRRLTIHNNVFMKLIMVILALTFLSTFLIRPILYVVNKNKLKSLIKFDKVHIKKYHVRFFIISVSIISLIILFFIATLPEAVFQSGLPPTLTGVPELTKYKILLPFVNLFFLITLSILYTIGLIKNGLSTYRKWHTFSIISASVILLILLKYWGFIKLYV